MAAYGSRHITAAVRAAVIDRDGLACQRCGVSVVRRGSREPYQPNTLHLDHVEPWAAGGSNDADNLIVCCAACNLRRAKPRAIVRQAKVRVEYRSGTYYWPADYSPPKIITGLEPRHELHSVRGLASHVGLTEAQVVQMIHKGDFAASDGAGPIVVHLGPMEMVRPVTGTIRTRVDSPPKQRRQRANLGLPL